MSFEEIYDLEPDQSELLFSEIIDGQQIEIRQWQQYRWLQIDGESLQALIDMDDINEIALPNIKALLSAFVIHPSAKKILNLGLGGGSLERYLSMNFSEIEFKSIECNEKVIELAREFFYLPDNLNITLDTAEHFLARNNEQFDILLCDIFANETQPQCMYDAGFYADAASALSASGVMAINLLPDSEDDVIAILLPMKNHFNHISLYEVPNHFNVVIFASNQKLPENEELNRVADELFEEKQLDLRDMPERLNRLLETL